MAEQNYSKRQRRISIKSVAMIGGIFAFTAIVFGILFGAGSFIAGS